LPAIPYTERRKPRRASLGVKRTLNPLPSVVIEAWPDGFIEVLGQMAGRLTQQIELLCVPRATGAETAVKADADTRVKRQRTIPAFGSQSRDFTAPCSDSSESIRNPGREPIVRCMFAR